MEEWLQVIFKIRPGQLLYPFYIQNLPKGFVSLADVYLAFNLGKIKVPIILPKLLCRRVSLVFSENYCHQITALDIFATQFSFARL